MNHVAYTIRRATHEDLPTIERITHSAYQPWVAVVGSCPGPMDEDYEALIANNGVHVATTDHMVAGVLALDVVSDALVIRNVAVAPRHQGRGLGGQFLSFAEATADSRGLGMVRLFAHERMGPTSPGTSDTDTTSRPHNRSRSDGSSTCASHSTETETIWLRQTARPRRSHAPALGPRSSSPPHRSCSSAETSSGRP